MENEGMLTPREAWERRQNGEDVATGSRAGYETARGTLLHNSTLLLGEKCLVRNDISGWNDNPWWVRVTMTDESKIMYARRYLEQLQEMKNQIREEISDELLED